MSQNPKKYRSGPSGKASAPTEAQRAEARALVAALRIRLVAGAPTGTRLTSEDGKPMVFTSYVARKAGIMPTDLYRVIGEGAPHSSGAALVIRRLQAVCVLRCVSDRFDRDGTNYDSVVRGASWRRALEGIAHDGQT